MHLPLLPVVVMHMPRAQAVLELFSVQQMLQHQAAEEEEEQATD
jgi:hypothetical protein